VQTGCLCKQKSSGLPLTAEDDVERIRASFLHSPKKSTGTAAKELSMSKTTVWRVLRKRFLIIDVCNHGEHYETPCIYSTMNRQVCWGKEVKSSATIPNVSC
jgi:hypothetical protein